MIQYLYVDEYWPVFLIAFGLAFIVKFIVHPEDWGALIPGTLLLFYGSKCLLSNFEEFYWQHDLYIDDLWPMIIIVIGIGMVVSGFLTSKKINANRPDPASSTSSSLKKNKE